ncbi:unnamed protein product [Chrysoparadoxa australica]
MEGWLTAQAEQVNSLGNGEGAAVDEEGEELVLTLPYCGLKMRWLYVLDALCPIGAPDLIPMPALGCADPSEAEACNPSFDTPWYNPEVTLLLRGSGDGGPIPLVQLCGALETMWWSWQKWKLEQSELGRTLEKEGVISEWSSIAPRPDVLVGMHMRRVWVKMAAPLWDHSPKGDESMDQDQQPDNGAAHTCPPGSGVLHFVWGRQAASKVSAPKISISLPEAMELTRAGFSLPKWLPRGNVLEYVQSVKDEVLERWHKRRRFVAALASLAPLLEFDPEDYARIFLFVEVYQGEIKEGPKLRRIISFDMPYQFPDIMPDISVQSTTTPKAWTLEKHDFRFSPRWEESRLAESLFLHTLRQIPVLATSDGNGGS